MSEEELRPNLVRRRRRDLFRLTLMLAIPLQVAVLAYCRPRPRVETFVVSTTEPAPVIIPFVTPVISVTTHAAARTSCPPPRTDAPRLVPPELPEDIAHVRPSLSNAGWIAAWNDEHVFVSTDAGASFRRVLDGEGAVRDVDFDCYGHAIVVRGDRVGVRAGASEHWRSLPGLQLADRTYEDNYVRTPDVYVLGGGPDVVIVGHEPATDSNAARLAVSEDLAASWRYHDLHDYVEGRMIGRQHANGQIDVGVIVVDCMSEDLLWVRVANGVVDATMRWIDGTTAALHGNIALTGHAWQRRGAEEWTPIAGLDEAMSLSPVDDAPYLIGETTAYRVTRGRAKALPWIIEGAGHAVDPAGRIWSVVCGQPWIAQRTASGRTCEP